MSDPTVPPAVVKAAKRGFIRTTAQAYAATLATGVSASVIIGLMTGTVDVLVTAVTFGAALVSPLLAGLVSYLNILSKGIPEDYAIPTPPVRFSSVSKLKPRAGDKHKIENPDLYPVADVQAARARAGLPAA